MTVVCSALSSSHLRSPTGIETQLNFGFWEHIHGQHAQTIQDAASQLERVHVVDTIQSDHVAQWRWKREELVLPGAARTCWARLLICLPNHLFDCRLGAAPPSITRFFSASRFCVCLSGYRDQILRFNLSPALWTYQRSQTGRASLGFKKSFALLKHSFIGAMFKPLCDIPWTSVTLQLSLMHYLIPPLW